MVFPLAAPLEVLSPFGVERDDGERLHKGVDLSAPRMTPVLAVKDGVVTRINHSSVSVFLRHDDGWSSWYLHLNNDTYLTDDGLGGGVVPGLEVGDRVVAGQVIGWVGDSGNAEPTPPHLHFELHNRWGEAVDPLRSLRAATWVDEVIPPSFEGAFVDDDGHSVAPMIDLLASRALISGCGPYGLEICPDDELTGGDLEALLSEALGVEVSVADHLHFASRPAFLETFRPGVELEDALGCGIWQYCPEQVISRGDLAAVVAAVFEVEPTDFDYFIDDEGHYAEAAINSLAAVEVFDTCTTFGPAPFEPGRPVTRAELFETMAKAFGLVAGNTCRVMA
jgi:hypothetical protein